MIRLVTLLLLTCLQFNSQAQTQPFQFVALGDTAYNLPQDLPVYDALIQKINASKPAFSIHVGDTWGAMPCTEEKQRWIKSWFDKYEQPVIYTPGDNEWTDCRKPELIQAYLKMLEKKASKEEMAMLGAAQTFDSELARNSYADTNAVLTTIREVFFGKAKSLGQQSIALERQSDSGQHKQMVENARWTHGEVLFATVNVPGSDMNFVINDEAAALEAIARNKADVAWIQSSFETAQAQNAKAVVIALHASLFVTGEGDDFSNNKLRGGKLGPYYWIARAIRDSAGEFGKPVLLINGDFHEFLIDQPFRLNQGEGTPPKFDNITRLQVYGAPDIKAVTVTVDTSTPWVFSFSPLY